MSPSLKRLLLAVPLLAALAAPAMALSHGDGPRAGGPFAALSQAKSTLNLSSEQNALFDAAEKATHDAMDAMKAQHEKMKTLLDEQKKQAMIDLQKLSDQTEALHETGRAAHDKARDAWLKAYASLSTAQKQTVSDLLKQQMQKHEQWMQSHRRGPGHEMGKPE